MDVEFFDEPELEFLGGTHIDIRFGIMQYGLLDRGTDLSPNQIRVGLVGTEDTTRSVRKWLQKICLGVPAKKTHLSNLFPPFPGFSRESCFGSELIFHDKWTAVMRNREIDNIISSCDPGELVSETVELFISYAEDIIEPGGPSVLIVVPPENLLSILDDRAESASDLSDAELDEGSDDKKTGYKKDYSPCFHDLLKAKAMKLSTPVQMIRPSTYVKTTGRKFKKGRKRQLSLQDEATRAWNLLTALYYKAGGTLWRLTRDPSEYSACYVGISFYRSIDRDRLLTSVAQVFNERGEGVIVRGANAFIDKNDRQPHLSKNDAYDLLCNAIKTYRKEHRTIPARLVIHKTSMSNSEEIDGFREATDNERIDTLDLLNLRRSFTRLFRIGTYPPIRGSYIQLDDRSGLIYLRGSVPFFQCYPGLYIPKPIEFHVSIANSGMHTIAKEILALSKLNWNNTQFDGGEPITVRAARRVGDILKCVSSDENIQNNFRYFV